MILRRVVGGSMEPTLQPGQLVVALKRSQYKSGDVVMFKHDGKEKIKRILSVVSSDAISSQAAGQVFVDVRGDNAGKSTDSRDFGLVQGSSITGKIIWPRV